MSEQKRNTTKNQICLGLLAHVDAGKTTLSEAMLYEGGQLRRLGRVDHQDAFLDTDVQERERGITIFSKQAVLPLEHTAFTLLDTPGHVDFSSEMERTLQVLDYAVLVISGTDGVQSHTRTLWRLLERYNVPTFLFINKMDLDGADQDLLLKKSAFFAILKTDFSRADTERPLFYCIRGVSENKFTAFQMHPKGAYFRTHETYELRKGNDHEENRF